MEHKSWPWRKRSFEKTMVVNDKVNKGNEEEMKAILAEKEEMEQDLKILNEKLSAALAENNAKDDIAKKQTRIAREAIAGWEKAESEVLAIKQELDKVIQQRIAGEERFFGMDAALKECMQQLRLVREEQEKKIHDAVLKTSREFEKTKIILEEKLAETSKRLAKLSSENTQLSKALLAKERMINDLHEIRAEADAQLSTMMSRLESTEKKNASLNYEVRVLQKEHEIRNEEREFNRRTAEMAHKQHLESAKKIAKLESENQRLRLLVRKRLPGPAALSKMKNEVEMLGRDTAEFRRRMSNPFPIASKEFSADNISDPLHKKINFLNEQLSAVEEENMMLKEIINRRTGESQPSGIISIHTPSKLSQAKAQMEESSNSQASVRSAKHLSTPHELFLASSSDIGSDEKASITESWAPSCRTVGASDIGLMDDFVEMEKLAIVSVENPFGSSNLAVDTHSLGYSSEATEREIVPVSDFQPDCSLFNQETHCKRHLVNRDPVWMANILKVILEHARITKRHSDDVVEDIKVALAGINEHNPCESVNEKTAEYCYASEACHVVNSFEGLLGPDISSAKVTHKQFHSDLNKPIQRLIELIEGITSSSREYGTLEILSGKENYTSPYKTSESSTGYKVRVFQWKTSELDAVLQQFIQSCTGLLNGKTDVENFAKELTSALEWIVNHCFSLQDVSSMRDEIKKHFDWDESRSENEIEGRHSLEVDRLHFSKDQLSGLPTVSGWNVRNSYFEMEEPQPNIKEESRRLKDELENMETTKRDLEQKLQSEISKSEAVIVQLQKSEKTIDTLQMEVEALKQGKGMMQDQIKHHDMEKEDLGKDSIKADFEMVEAHRNSISEVLKHRSNCSQEPEAPDADQQLQLESVTEKDVEKYYLDQDERKLRTDREITAASEKLAECQETILNLGKQLKALTSPKDLPLSDITVCSPAEFTTTSKPIYVDSTFTNTTPNMPRADKNNNQRTSLLDKMMAEDCDETGELKSPVTTEVVSLKSPTRLHSSSYPAFSPQRFLSVDGIKHQEEEEALVNFLSIVPSKKKSSGGFLKRLLSRGKKANSKTTSLPRTAK